MAAPKAPAGRPPLSPAGWLARVSAREPEGPVQHSFGVLRGGRSAGGGTTEHEPDQRPAVPARLEQQAVPGIVGVPALDPDGAVVRADQRVGVVPPVLLMPAPLRQMVEPQV